MSRLLDGKNQITQKYKKGVHNGIDLVKYKSKTCNIFVHSDGVVVDVVSNCNKTYKTGHSYGNYVKIKHYNGYYTLYAHLKYGSVKVKKGQKVKKGDVIGYMGNTGHSLGAHLHWEVRNVQNVRINPTNYINADLPKGFTKGLYQLNAKKYVRTGPGTGYDIKKVKDLTPGGQKNATSTKPNALAEYRVGTRFDALEIEMAKNYGLWAKTPSGYICIVSASGTEYATKIK